MILLPRLSAAYSNSYKNLVQQLSFKLKIYHFWFWRFWLSDVKLCTMWYLKNVTTPLFIPLFWIIGLLRENYIPNLIQVSNVLSEFHFYVSNRINYPQFYCQTAKEERNCIPLSLLMKRTEKIYFHISFQKVKLIQLQSDCEQLFQKQDSSEYTILAESMYKKKRKERIKVRLN